MSVTDYRFSSARNAMRCVESANLVSAGSTADQTHSALWLENGVRATPRATASVRPLRAGAYVDTWFDTGNVEPVRRMEPHALIPGWRMAFRQRCMLPGFMDNAVVLRYFSLVGRAQPLRHALADAAVAFDDVRISLAEWPQHKEEPSFAGPFSGLPTLSWGPAMVSETLSIASFLARRLGHYEGLDDAGIAHLEAVCSNCYIEVTLRIGELIWADVLYPGGDLAGGFQLHIARMLDKLTRLDRQTPEAGWLGGSKPVMADFYAAEAVEALRYLLGPAREERLRLRLPRLTELAQRVRVRPALARAWENRPEQFTARPDESAVIERLRALDLSQAGL